MSEGEPKYSLEKAQEEAELLKKKMESGEAKDYNEAEKIVETKKLEKELSPEAKKMIMEKIQDINLPEIAFHTIIGLNRRDETLQGLLQDGILGVDTKTRREEKYKSDFNQRQAWITDMKKKGELPKVWFDISGRYTQSAPTMKDSFWLRTSNATKPLSITIVFDLSKYNDPIGTYSEYQSELEKIKDSGSSDPEKDFIKQNSKLGSYMPADTEGPDIHFMTRQPDERTRGGWDSGYVLFGRIPPRFFQAIVVRYFREEVDKYGENTEETNPSIIQEKVLEIANEMLSVDKDKPNLLLPIYDTQGNLLWPEQMDHEEVQKIIAERESKKKDESE